MKTRLEGKIILSGKIKHKRDPRFLAQDILRYIVCSQPHVDLMRYDHTEKIREIHLSLGERKMKIAVGEELVVIHITIPAGYGPLDMNEVVPKPFIEIIEYIEKEAEEG